MLHVVTFVFCFVYVCSSLFVFLSLCVCAYLLVRVHMCEPLTHSSLRSFSSERSNTLNRSSFARDSMMIEEILVPTKDKVRMPTLYCSHHFTVFLLFSSAAAFPPLRQTFLRTVKNVLQLHFLLCLVRYGTITNRSQPKILSMVG